jgi:ATP-dependent DNA helicase RecG
MSKPGLQFFINQGEGYNLEFKEAFSDRIAVDFCAFANATGGKLILGISDDGQVRGLVKRLTIKDLGRKSLSRNNLLFGLMQRMDLVEKIGSGIMRMRNAMASYGLDGPEFETDENWFTVIFRRKPVSERAIGSEKSSEKILRIIRENPEISAKKMAGFLGITSRAVEKRLAELKARGFIERIGPAKGGRWVVRGDGG